MTTAKTPSGSPVASSIRALLLVLLALGVACSKGDSEDGPEPPPGPLPLTRVELEEASRFLAQATLGASFEEIEHAARLGPQIWLDEQRRMPPSYHLPLTIELLDDFADPTFDDVLQSPIYRRFAWWERVMEAPDVLRQRVALALSEILVISDRVDLLFIQPRAVASYYDVLVEHALGNYEDLLLAVSLHPSMGIYLSHLNNDRGDPAVGRFPDENYAREVMQLFSIGLVQLDPDGTPTLDSGGNTIPTYTNLEITELAKVFTGLGLQGDPASAFGGYLGDFQLPMVMYDANHEPGAKQLLDGFVIPGGQSGMQDVRDAVAHLADHPNTGPFIARRLIQRLVHSNPSPAYVQRVAAVFADDGRGVRGNLAAVVEQILLDPEARSAPVGNVAGRLREPFLRWVSLLRTFDASSPSGHYFIDDNGVGFLIAQQPMNSPSVFNFFQPDFAPNGVIRDSGNVAPEFQITTASTVAWITNLMTFFSFGDPAGMTDLVLFRPGVVSADEIRIQADLSDELAAAADTDELLDRLDLLLTYGGLSDETRDDIFALTDPLPVDLRVPMALHLILLSPDYAVAD